MTHTISQVSRALSVSTRALRYYEEMGLIHSRRIEGYAYRVYDEDTVRRIEQILFLRSVRIPLRDIAVLLRGEDTREAIEIFRRRIAEMDAEIDQLTAVRRLLRYLQEKVSVSGSEGWKESVPLLPEEILLPRENSIPPMPSLPQDVRILSLPRLTVAAAHCICEQPEDAADALLTKFIRQTDLLHVKPDARVFGFNHPNPTEGNPVYGYEFQITIPPDLPVPAPLLRKEMPGGLYAAHAIKMGDFHEWTALAGWTEQSPDWEIRWASDGTEIMGRSLEEHLNYLQDRAAGRLQTGQLDLLLPIQKRRESQ